MTITVTIVENEAEGSKTHSVGVSDSAKRAVRHSFNPSGLERVAKLKCLAAAFISEAEAIQREMPEAAREAAVAITNMQTASMWGVLAATTNAPPKS